MQAQHGMNHNVENQETVFSFLGDAATFGTPVRRIDTHAACVFLAGPRALKVKRAVRFPFLDYSTLARRKQACEAELAVNQPYAPDLYRRVVAITREDDGTLALGGAGEPIEWAVEMRRFDETQTFDRLAAEDRIDATLADQLGRVIAAGHGQAPSVAADPWIEALARFLAQNRDAFAAEAELFPSDAAERLNQQSHAALERLTPLLRQRGRDGRIRRGHGDLHLGNIVLIDRAPVLFDAIEFDPLVAAGDVLYDLGFLLMDLVHRGRADLAARVLNRYLIEAKHESDLDALAALPLFLSLRAAIRAKVTAARRAHAGPGEQAAIADEARGYFALACTAMSPPPPQVVAVGGLSGTGKSILAQALCADLPPLPGAVVLRSDVRRKQMFGVAETERLPESAYAPEITARLYAQLTADAERIVAAGHSVIVDAVFARASERAAVAEMATKAGAAFRGLFLTADLETRIRRVSGRRGDASDADADVARRQEAYLREPVEWLQIDAGGNPEETLARARAALQAA